MSTDLTTTNATHGGLAIAAPSLAIEGMEGLTQRDVILPRWSLIQPTSRKPGADDHVGEFLRNLDGEYRDALDVVVLEIQPSRLLWSGDASDTRPECFSRDGHQGSVYGACGSCAFNVSVNPDLLQRLRNGEPVKACQYGYTYVVVDDLETETPALLGAMGTSVRPSKILNSQFALRKRPPFSALVHVESEKQTNERGKYYVLKLSVKEWLSTEETAHWREMYQALHGATIRDVDEEVVEEGGEVANF